MEFSVMNKVALDIFISFYTGEIIWFGRNAAVLFGVFSFFICKKMLKA